MSHAKLFKLQRPFSWAFLQRLRLDSGNPGVIINVPYTVTGTGTAVQPSPSRSPMVRSAGYVPPVSGVPAPSMGATANNRFTNDAEFLLRSTGERIAWQGKPSLLCLLPRTVAWTAVIILSIIWAANIRQGYGWILFWLLIATLHTGIAYLNWRHTTYRITSQRVEYSRGVFSSTTAASPLSEIGNVTIFRPFPWNLLGLGHLELDIPDQSIRPQNGFRPKVRLRYITNLETTRDLIHSSSNIFNQLWDQHRF